MRVLLDECLPNGIKHHLPGHEVFTVKDMGWKGKKNGALLAAMKNENIDALLTVDQNLAYQQNLKKSGIALIAMISRSNRLDDLLPFMQSVLDALLVIQPGDVVEIEGT